MTGSRAQWYNGLLLLMTFFSCRIIWGTWQSVLVYRDMWVALKQTWEAKASSPVVDVNPQVFGARWRVVCADELCVKANAEVSEFAQYTAGGIPTWLVATYVASNLVLNSLNYYWFSKMIDAVMKRFKDVGEKKGKKIDKEEMQQTVVEASGKLGNGEDGFLNGTGADAGGASVKELRNRTVRGASS